MTAPDSRRWTSRLLAPHSARPYPTAHPYVLSHADLVRAQPAGAIRELVDLALSAQGHDITELRPGIWEGIPYWR